MSELNNDQKTQRSKISQAKKIKRGLSFKSSSESDKSDNHSHHSHQTCHRINFLPSTQQFSKYLENNFVDAFNYDVQGYFDKISQLTHVDYYDIFMHYIIVDESQKRLKDKFQQFLTHKCIKFETKKIDLDNLYETCDTDELQTLLLMSILYYFT